MITFPHGLPRATHERVAQLFFERFNVAGFSTLERPLAQLYAANVLNGLAVEIGWDRTDIVPVYECTVQHNCVEWVPVGVKDCEMYLASLLRANEQVMGVLSPSEAPLSDDQLEQELRQLARKIWLEGYVKLGEAEVGSTEEEGAEDHQERR